MSNILNQQTDQGSFTILNTPVFKKGNKVVYKIISTFSRPKSGAFMTTPEGFMFIWDFIIENDGIDYAMFSVTDVYSVGDFKLLSIENIIETLEASRIRVEPILKRECSKNGMDIDSIPEISEEEKQRLAKPLSNPPSGI